MTNLGCQALAGSLRLRLERLPGVAVGPCPLPHVTALKITYGQSSKKEKAAATRIAKAAKLGEVVRGWTPPPPADLRVEPATLQLLQIDTRPDKDAAYTEAAELASS